jgi:hypothetical protein
MGPLLDGSLRHLLGGEQLVRKAISQLAILAAAYQASASFKEAIQRQIQEAIKARVAQ